MSDVYAVVVAFSTSDRMLERQNELEAGLTAIQTYFRTEREKELAAEDQARREKVKRILKDINADIARFNRATLARRGVIRGRRF